MWAEDGLCLDKSLVYIKRALAIEPCYGAYLDTLGWIYYKLRNYDLALTHVRQANALLVGDPTILEHLGDIFAVLDNETMAILHWRLSYSFDRTNEKVRRKLKTRGVNIEEWEASLSRSSKGNTPATKDDNGH